jgi:HD-GYP domain-containing protein (c-di-GMP phosphodiesterase class II)
MWTTIDPRKLKVGHYVRVEHSWLSHPFPRSTFTIASQRDLQLIEEYRIKRVSFDPGRSTIAEDLNIIVGGPQPTEPEPTPEAPVRTEEPVRVKQRMVQEVQARRQRLESLSRDFVREARATVEAHRLIDAGEPGGFVMMESLAAQAVQDSGVRSAALCFAGTALASAALDRDSAATVSAMALAAELGHKLELDEELNRAIAVAAALRAISLRRLPPADRNRSTLSALPLSSALRNYPQVSAEILERAGKVPVSVLRIVAQHRECLDGSGFPHSLKGEAIAPGAALVGLVHEYQELTAPGRTPRVLSPSDAVRLLYQSRRDQFGATLMHQFIAALSIYPPGTFVQLSDDSLAVVVRVNPEQRLRPVVLMLEDRESLHEGDIQDLSRSEDLRIVSAHPADSLPPLAAAFAGLTDVIGLKIDRSGGGADA